jgi:hypothetical protein
MANRKPLGGIFSKLFPRAENQKITFPGNSAGNSAGTNAVSAFASASVVPKLDTSRISILSIITYLVVIIIIVGIFLIFIDRFITPIFKYKPGDPGYIPLPYGDDGVLYWPKNPGTIRDDSTILANIASGYTLSLDIFIFNPMAFATTPRVIFWRGSQAQNSAPSSAPNQKYRISEFNLLFSLNKDTNDLMVDTILDTPGKLQRDIQSVRINNVPIRKGFRVTVVMFNKLMEVYLNGRLYQTRTLPASPLGSFHFFNPQTLEGQASTAIRNLKIWNRCLSANEVREMSPPIDSFSDFDNIMPATCANISDTIQNIAGIVPNKS